MIKSSVSFAWETADGDKAVLDYLTGKSSTTVTGWTFYGPTGSGATIATSGAKEEGASLAQVAFGSSYVGGNTQLYQKNLSLTAGAAYTLKFWARSTTGGDLQVVVHEHDEDFTNYGLSTTANLTSSWQELTYTFISRNFTGSVTDGRLRFSFNPYAAAGATYYIDGVRLYRN